MVPINHFKLTQNQSVTDRGKVIRLYVFFTFIFIYLPELLRFL